MHSRSHFFSPTQTIAVKPALTAKSLGKTFKPTGGSVQLKKSGKSINFLFEVVRREADWQKKLADKMNMYQDFYKNFVPGDSGYEMMPQLIFVCEDEKNMVEVFKEIVTQKLEIPEIKLYFTTDLRQNEESLTTSLTEFILDEKTNKYKAETVNLKLLD